MFTAVLFLLLFFQADVPVFSAAPGEAGTWLLRNGVRLEMPPATVSAAETVGLDNYIYTDGYTDLDMDVSFAGSDAALRISDRSPVFIVKHKDDNNNYEPVLVRLQKKNDRRVCRTRPDSASVDNKHGFRRNDIVRTLLTVNPDKSLTVRPERPLKPGEYLFVTDPSGYGSDFGID